jgi:DNA-binding SARP family transcriptional activator/Flp pilus assembly protein TadD
MLPDPERLLAKIDDSDRIGDSQALLSSAYEAVEKARRYDPARLAQALTTYTRLLIRDVQYERARSCAKEVLLLEQNTNHAVEAIIALGMCAAQSNQLDEAETLFNQSADLARKINYPLGLARSLQYLTNSVLLIRGQFHLALTLIEEAGILFEEQGSNHWTEPFLRGMIYQIVGDRRHARQILDELVLQIEPGTRLAAAYYFLWARLAIDEDELEQAKEYLRLGLRVANRIGVIDLNQWIRLEYSRYHRIKNEAAAARTWAEDALHQAQRNGSLYFSGLALLEHAQDNWDTGDRVAAKADLEEAFRVLEPLRAAYDLARVRFLRALWLREANEPEAEAAWMEAARHMIREGYAFILEKEQDLAFPLIAAHMRSKTPGVRATTEELLGHLANVSPPALRVAALGQFAVWKGRRRIADQAWSRRKAGELFRYLLLQTNRAAGREVIIEALWPDSISDSPEDLLHQATSALRHALEPDLPDKFPSRYLKVEGEHIALILPTGSMVDFEDFERVLPLAIQTHAAERLQEALNLYSGELFPSDRYADWSEEKRQLLAELRQRGLLSLAKAYLDQNQLFNVITCCRQILSVDAWNEDAVLLIMQAYAGMQDVPHALHMYQELKRTLKEELDIEPRSDLRELAKKLRER